MTSTIIGESVRGESHKRHNIVRQDNYLVVQGLHNRKKKNHLYNKDLPDGFDIVAVADGHGSESCPFSDIGSKIATKVFCDMMTEYVIEYEKSEGGMDDLFISLNKEGETTRIAKKIVQEWEEQVLKDFSKQQNVELPHKDDGEIDPGPIWKKYGTTLLGLLITPDFFFAYQLGDGDITYVDIKGVSPVIEGDKILGVETHSISKPDSWKKVITKVVKSDSMQEWPSMIVISTDGWINSHASEQEFHKTCMDYYNLIQEKGAEVIEANLESWLSETSKLGCGDDITAVFVYIS